MRIFINYRYDDTAWVATMLHHKLAERYGRDRVFLDSQEIPLGVDFRTVLWPVLVRSTVLLVVIGPRWLTVRAQSRPDTDPRDGVGLRRIDHPDDDLRKEIEEALRLDMKIIPVLVDGVPMPTERELPDTIKPLAVREYVRLNAGTAQYEIRRLLDELDRLLADVDGFEPPSGGGERATDHATGEPRPAPHVEGGGIVNAGQTTVHGDQVGRDKFEYPAR